MKNRFILLLAAGSIGMTASAQSVDWKLYGTLMTFVDTVKTTGATQDVSASNSLVTIASTATNVPSRGQIGFGTSNLGFKGSYPINDDLKLIWQVETAIYADGDAPPSSAYNFANRNSAIGLAGTAWGQVIAGSWDTPYKVPTLFLGAERGLAPFDQTFSGVPGFNVPGTTTQSQRVNGKADASFSRRQGNSIQYWSPEFHGFSGRVAYSVNEGKTTSDSAVQTSPSIVSATVTYKWQTLSVTYGYEQHKDYFGLSAMLAANVGAAVTTSNPSSRDEGHELVATYVLPSSGTRITALLEQLKYHNSDAVSSNINEYKRFAWNLEVQQSFNKDHKVWASYGQAGAGDASRGNGASTSTDGLGSKQVTVGYDYALGKSANVFAAYYTTINDKTASYGPFPQISTTAINPGADLRGLGVGMLYSF